MTRRPSPLLRWAGYLAIAIVFGVVCVLLSNWQFDRNDERSHEIALVEQNFDAPAVPIQELVSGDEALDEDDQWRPVVLEGRYLTDRQLLVRNRPHGGTSAFEVLVPFELADGSVVIVNRGWVPPGEGDLPDAIPAAPTGEATVIGRLMPGEPQTRSGRGAPDGQVATIHLDTITDLVGDETMEGAYVLMSEEDPAPTTTPSAIDPPSADPGPHLSYAIQWILFAVMGFVFIWYMIRTELRHRQGKPERSKPRRKDRDADVEDALLDA